MLYLVERNNRLVRVDKIREMNKLVKWRDIFGMWRLPRVSLVWSNKLCWKFEHHTFERHLWKHSIMLKIKLNLLIKNNSF